MDEKKESSETENSGCEGCGAAIVLIIIGFLLLLLPGIGWIFGIICFVYAGREMVKFLAKINW